MSRRLAPHLLVLLCAAALAAACDVPPESNDETSPAGPTGAVEQAVTFTCASTLCSGAGEAYGTAYRIGVTDTARHDLMQVFKVAVTSTPTAATLVLRSLRPFTSPLPLPLQVEVYAVASATAPSIDGLVPVASGTHDLAGADAFGAVAIPLEGGPLVAGTAYALLVRVPDALPAGATGTLLVGVGALATASETFQGADYGTFRRNARRPNAASSFVPSRFRPAGGWDLALGLEATPVPTTITTGLVARWPITEGTGTSVADGSGAGRTMTLNGTATWRSTGCAPGHAACLELTGAGSLVNSSSYVFSSTNEVTLAAWVKLAAANNGYSGIVSANHASLRLMVNSGPVPYWDAGTHSDQWSGDILPVGTWFHYAMTVKGGGLAVIYVNGVAVESSSASVPGTLPNYTGMLVGAGEGTNFHLARATLNDARIYNRALTPAELAAITAGNG